MLGFMVFHGVFLCAPFIFSAFDIFFSDILMNVPLTLVLNKHLTLFEVSKEAYYRGERDLL